MTCQNVSEFFMLHIKYSRLGGLLFIRCIALNSMAQHFIIEPDIDQEQKLQSLKFLSRRWATQAE